MAPIAAAPALDKLISEYEAAAADTREAYAAWNTAGRGYRSERFAAYKAAGEREDQALTEVRSVARRLTYV